MSKLEDIRNKLKAIENKRSGGSQTMDNSVYPFWNIPVGKTSTIRFLNDADESNTFFWVERQLIKIPFKGIKGNDENKQVVVQVPCIEMWNETCPVHAEIRAWFNDPELEPIARTYWKKRSYVFQGFVRENPLTEDTLPENPIRRFIIRPQIFNIIKSALLDVDMVNLPTDIEKGTDFRLTKAMKGKYADYSTSKWARVESGLTQEERDAIEKHKLYNLSEFLPKRPTAEQLAAIYEMFKASVDGDMYDQDRWGKLYRPFGLDRTETDVETEETEGSTQTVSTPVTEKVATATVSASPEKVKSTQDILNSLRNRNKSN